IALWIQAELIAMATDLAEFLGAALGFHLLLGIPLFPAALITAVAAFLILGLQRFGFRPLEAVIAAIVAVIGICYVGELWYAHPALGQVARHAVLPKFSGTDSVLLAVGILGATVMPHVIYLHSALTQNRMVPKDDKEALRLYRFTRIDVVIAMTLAGLINVAMLAVAAAVFYNKHLPGPLGDLEVAGQTLKPLLGGAAGTLFALALLSSGLASSAIGTLAGQVVMQGFLRRKVPIVVRRAVTMLPALVVIGIGADATRTLVVSQVVLSFGIPFALIPLVRFTSDREVMGALVNRRATVVIATIVAGLIVALNAFLLVQTLIL
ncbi:MAG: manganese transport protein, partial [Gaiellaceae bacterium]|nr:manganese transport protein [Gaiellaceae bacterium]